MANRLFLRKLQSIRRCVSTALALGLALSSSGCLLALVVTPAATTKIAATASSSPPLLAKVSWSYGYEGDCDGTQTGLRVLASDGATVLATRTCTLLLAEDFKVYVDLSTQSVGVSTYIVQKQVGGAWVESTRFNLNKLHTLCDSSAQRVKTYAQGLSGGSGIEADPYLVCTVSQLDQIRNGTSSSYSLASHLYFGNTDTNGDGVTNGSDLSGAWSALPAIYGVVSGASYSIEDFQVSAAGYVGLFGTVVMLRDLTLKTATVTSTGTNAAVVGWTCYSLYNVHVVNGALSANSTGGGLCGALKGAIVRSSYSGTVTTTSGAGGLVNAMQYGSIISNSKFSGTVTGTTSVGGISGGNSASVDTLIVDSYSTGTVRGSREVGGISGSYGTLLRCYSTASVQHTGAMNSFHGGLIGYSSGAGSTTDSVFAGTVTGSGNSNNTAGPIGGLSGATVPGTVYLASSFSTCTNGGFSCNSMGISVATTSSLWNRALAPLSQWDSQSSSDGTDDTWVVTDGTPPTLWWETESSWSAPFSGAGTPTDPYLITDADAFQKLGSNARYLASNFKLQSNLTSTGGFLPIAETAAFSGALDGQGFSFDPQTITSGIGPVGLFGRLASARISNLQIANANISTSRDQVGALAGFAITPLQLYKLVAVDPVIGSTGANVGGLIGTVIGEANCPGISRSSAQNVSVTGVNATGGLVGSATYLTAQDVYSTGTVTGAVSTGGLFGSSIWNNLARGYSSVAVAGTTSVGGIVGSRTSNVGNTLRNFFFAGTVTGTDAGATSVGLILGTVSDATGSSGSHAGLAGSCTNTSGCNSLLVTSNVATTTFQNPANAPLTTWNFATIWIMPGAAYPLLQ